jgi:hypothetical protein
MSQKPEQGWRFVMVVCLCVQGEVIILSFVMRCTSKLYEGANSKVIVEFAPCAVPGAGFTGDAPPGTAA